MGPAIALRLRQHLTLTPQVQQALRLLQMSAMEFQQEMEQALAANPFLEENPDAPAPALAAAKDAPVEELYLPHESSGGGSVDREQEDWGGALDTTPSLQEHLREQLRMSRVSDRDRALAEMVIDSLDDDGYFKATFEELAALLPPEHDVLPEEFAAALKLVQSLDPAGIGARTLDECLCLQLQALPPDTPHREFAMAMCQHLQLLANRLRIEDLIRRHPEIARERIERQFPWEWIGWSAAAAALALIGAWFIVSLINRPLAALTHAARQVAGGTRPQALAEVGATELHAR